MFGFGAVASIPQELSDAPVAAVVTGVSAAFAIVVGNLRGYLRRQRTTRPSRPTRLAPAWSWEPARYAVAVLLAGAAAIAVGIGHQYWAMVAAVAPLSARGITAQLVRAGHRIVGTLLGLVTSAILLSLGLEPVATVLVVVVLQIVTELLVGRNYGLALLFITPMALLMGQIAVPRPMGSLLLDRGVETVIGACIGGAIILLGWWRRQRRAQSPDRDG